MSGKHRQSIVDRVPIVAESIAREPIELRCTYSPCCESRCEMKVKTAGKLRKLQEGLTRRLPNVHAVLLTFSASYRIRFQQLSKPLPSATRPPLP